MRRTVSLVVWKYPFPLSADRLEVELPVSSRVLAFGFQGPIANFWALVDPEREIRVTRRFRIFGTGHPLPDRPRFDYIGTAFVGEFGEYIFHLFEEVGV